MSKKAEANVIAKAVEQIDRDRLVQVMDNLLSNAAKYSPVGETVEVALERRGPWLRVAVSDHDAVGTVVLAELDGGADRLEQSSEACSHGIAVCVRSDREDEVVDHRRLGLAGDLL